MGFEESNGENIVPFVKPPENHEQKTQEERAAAVRKMEAVLRDAQFDQNPLRANDNDSAETAEQQTEAELKNMRQVIAELNNTGEQDAVIEGKVSRLHGELKATIEALESWGGQALIGKFQAVQDELIEAFRAYLERITKV
jgi:hypothetical protein